MTSVEVTPVRSPARVRRSSTARALGIWLAVVVAGYFLVRWVMIDTGVQRHDAAPLHAMFDPELHRSLVWALLVGGAAIWGAERLAGALEWRRLLWVSALATGGWAIALSLVRGANRITVVFTRPGEYPQVLPRIESFNAFLHGFTDNLAGYPVHVQSHPPGFPLLAWALERLGYGGSLPLAMLCIAVAGVGVAATLVVVRDVAGERVARRAAPFVVFTPAAISIATSADAFFAGIGAVAVMFVVLATRRRDPAGDALAFVGGIAFGVAAFFSYGLVLIGVILLVIARHRRRVRPLIVAALGGALVVEAIWESGFFWFDGLVATRKQYFAGIASSRPYALYLFVDVAIFAVILGPAIAVALGRLRDRRLWLIVGGALAAVALADVSGMSKAEVERIWLPFAPFVTAAGAALACGGVARRRSRWTPTQGWLALQIGFAVSLELLIRTAW